MPTFKTTDQLEPTVFVILDSLRELKMAHPKTTAKRRQELPRIRQQLKK